MDKMPLELAQEGLFAHNPQHPLVADDPASSLERMRDALIACKVQNDPLNRITQFDIGFV